MILQKSLLLKKSGYIQTSFLYPTEEFMQKAVVVLFFLFFALNLSAFTTGTLSAPAKGTFYIPVSGFYLDNNAEDITIGSQLGVVYGLGLGCSLDFEWMHPFKQEVMSDDAFMLNFRKDFSFDPKSRFGLFISGGGGRIDNDANDWFFPLRAGFRATFPAAIIGGGISGLIDLSEKNSGTAWGSIEFYLTKHAILRVEYDYFIFDDIGFNQMVYAGFIFRI